jgi:glycosyltransferase involved in cell wall biosynthesis
MLRAPAADPVVARVSDANGVSPTGLRVLHLSSWETRCGIADYCANLVHALAKHGVESEVFPLNRDETKYFVEAEMIQLADRFLERAAGFDIVHIQHEFGLFAGAGSMAGSMRILKRILRGLRSLRKPVAVTFHTEPNGACWPVVRSLKPAAALRSAGGLLQRRRWKWLVSRRFSARAKGTMAIVHTKYSRLALVKSGFHSSRISVIPHAIIERSDHPWLDRKVEAKRLLGFPEDAVVLSMFGFIAKYKGPLFAAKLLRLLPGNYRLLVIGGTHPDNSADRTLDHLLRLKNEPDLSDRLRVTGYADKSTIDLCQGATDICLAPYLLSTQLSASGALAWALTSGRPVMASKIPAFLELNHAADCLSMVTAEAPFEWAWAVQRLAQNLAERDRLVTNARRFSSKLGWDRIASMTIGEYHALLGKRAGHP